MADCEVAPTRTRDLVATRACTVQSACRIFWDVPSDLKLNLVALIAIGSKLDRQRHSDQASITHPCGVWPVAEVTWCFLSYSMLSTSVSDHRNESRWMLTGAAFEASCCTTVCVVVVMIDYV